MGAANVIQAYAVWADLPDTAMRVFIRMAVTALDKDTPPRYFGGRDLLAQSLGRSWSAITDQMSPEERCEAERQAAAAYQAVGRAVAILVKRGAITRLNTAKAGTQAEYALNLDRLTFADRVGVAARQAAECVAVTG